MKRRAVYVLALMVASVPRARAQDDGDEASAFERLPVRCTTVAGDGIYLDRGRDARIAIGDEVRFLTAGGELVLGIITAVSRTSARAELTGSRTRIEVGARGEVLVPEGRADADEGGEAAHDPGPAPPAPAPRPARPPPEHPAWSRAPEEWQADMPLLAPVNARSAAERERRLRGSAWVGYDALREREGAASEQSSVRSGLELELENPFARADELRFESEHFVRRGEDEDGSESDSALRIERASDRRGGVRGRADRFEIGRFLQHGLPELGVLDGLEYTRRLRSGHSLGASLGFLPEPDDFFRSGKDLQAAFLYRHVSDETERLVLGAGLQKTWHEGSPDRDLLLATFDLHPDARTSLYGAMLVDYYTANDELKSSGFELTQLSLSAQRRSSSGHSLGLYTSSSRFPALERDEFPGLVPEQSEGNVFHRIGVNGRRVLSRHADAHGRLEFWSDQDDSGGSASVRLGLEDVLWQDGELALEPYFTQGKFHSGDGLRLSATRAFTTGALDSQLGLAWDTGNYEQADFDGAGSQALQHVLRFTWDAMIGAHWSLALFFESYLGDDQDGRALGLFLRRGLS